MLAEIPDLQRVVTSTTRPPRPGEVDTVDYHFFDKATFKEKIEAGEFYEYANVHRNLYGTLKREVQGKLEAGTDLLLNMDVQGAAHMRKVSQTDPILRGHVTTVFIMPPDIKELEVRLRGRATDAEDEIQRRLEVAIDEIKHRDHYDHTILSASPEADFLALKQIYKDH
jgi:guanylate kinase